MENFTKSVLLSYVFPSLKYIWLRTGKNIVWKFFIENDFI